MRRRSLLVTAGSLLTVSGCLGSDDPHATRTERSPERATDTTTSTDNAATADGTSADDVTLEVTTQRYVVEAPRVQRGAGPVSPDDVVAESDLPAVLRDALVEARSGQFETDSVSEDLLEAIDVFRSVGRVYTFDPYVSLDDTPYEFDPSVPVFTAHLVPDVDDHDPDRTVHYESVEGNDALEDFVGTLTVSTAHDDHSTYRMSVPPESVLEFVEPYDYIEDSAGVGRIETEWVDPGPPYTIDVRELTEVDFYGDPVADGESLPADQREYLESIVASERLAHLLPPGRHQYRSDDPPPTNLRSFSLDGERSTPYVRLEDTIYQFFPDEFRPETVPVTLATEPATSGDGPPRFTLTATVDEGIDDELKISARGGLPAVLGAETESGHVVVRGLEHDPYHWSEREEPPTGRYITNEERARLSPGGSVSATYELPASLSAGTHALWGQFEVFARSAGLDGSSRLWTYPFEVRVTVGGE